MSPAPHRLSGIFEVVIFAATVVHSLGVQRHCVICVVEITLHSGVRVREHVMEHTDGGH